MSESFTCPRCGAVSAHPRDLEEGYCGRCHDWTAAPDEAFRPLVKAVNEAFQPLADALTAAVRVWLERNRPAIEALAELAQDPRVQAYIAARERGEVPPPHRPCWCLCSRAHPGESVCDARAVTTRRYNSPALGPVDVQLCAPCAVAQGIAEIGG